MTCTPCRFQSTLSMRRATKQSDAISTKYTFQSTLSMRRATGNRRAGDWHDEISIHALHEESDEYASFLLHFHFLFQSTLSMRRATGRNRQAIHQPRISIHALHEESDRRQGFERQTVGISIHALHEESDSSRHKHNHHTSTFQSTLSMRRATSDRIELCHLIVISIHALHEESDPLPRSTEYV